SSKDYYAILGVPPSATLVEIKAAFRKRSFETHPDRNASPDATRRMAELIEARDVLTNPVKRDQFDRDRRSNGRGAKAPTRMGQHRREAARKPPTQPVFRKPPATGVGSIQPERLPDWYEFLGLRVTASTAEIVTALRRMQLHIDTTDYAPDDNTLLRRQVRAAADTLMTPKKKAIYDAAMEGKAPPAGQYPHLHPNWYTFLGISPRRLDELAERVTELSEGLKPTSAEYKAIQEAWRTLRDAERRAEYDAALRAEASAPAAG
ncbi:MAG: DnaJ domain-containing protein, partial [Dehalococcoidia bacterium]|nr:DnaJ domain-containing protein [Dehalococcoidia bacterium]